MTGEKPVVFTIGHSNRTLEAFVEMLEAHGVKRVVDVRTVPRSRHNPQFNRDSQPGAISQPGEVSLPQSLAARGIGYTHLAALGGLRKPRPDSPNSAWENLSFRGYADYMQTDEFERGLAALLALAEQEPAAVMCAEAVPWRCHRSLIGDALTARGIPVEDILSAARRQPHRLTPWAKVEGQRVTYPPPLEVEKE